MEPPDYTFDAARLAAVDRYAILDTPAEPGFDDIVQLAAQVCETPVAMVSLVANDRQWFKARVGFDPAGTDLNSSVCAHALVEPGLLVIPDLTKDRRTSANPLVTGPPHIRFYAGAPFRAATGEALGSLCVIDSQIRPDGLTPMQSSALQNLARQVSSQLDLRRALAERDELVAEQRLANRYRDALLHLGDELRDKATRADMTRLATTVVGQALNVSRAGFGYLHENGQSIAIEPDWTAEGVASIAGRYRLNTYTQLWDELLRGDTVAIDDILLDARSAANPRVMLDFGVRSLVYVPVREHGRIVAVLVVHDATTRRWPVEVIAFLRNVADRVEAGIARLTAQAEQDILNHELSHRLKNTFAMIQAIATQTLRSVQDQTPVEAFNRRLHALSAAHDALLKQKWTAARMSDVVRSVLANLVEASRISMTGPEIDIGPRATLSTSLLLHELATNAVKYGALSREGGRVIVEWCVRSPEGNAELVLTWQEIGGPPAAEPSRVGFGSKLIRMGLVGTGGVSTRFKSSGFEAEFRASLAQVQLS